MKHTFTYLLVALALVLSLNAQSDDFGTCSDCGAGECLLACVNICGFF